MDMETLGKTASPTGNKVMLKEFPVQIQHVCAT